MMVFLSFVVISLVVVLLVNIKEIVSLVKVGGVLWLVLVVGGVGLVGLFVWLWKLVIK